MENTLLLQFLRRKGIISERDIYEFQNFSSPGLSTNKTSEVRMDTDSQVISEFEAKEIVSRMYHTEGGKKYIGEKFDMYKAKEVCERYRGMLPHSATIPEIYIAINSQYHDYSGLFKNWFGNCIDHKIIESAITFWFMDEDCKSDSKVLKYLKQD